MSDVAAASKNTQERSIKYVPGSIPDLSELEVNLRNSSHAIAELTSQRGRIEAKLEAARAEIALRDELQHHCNVLSGKINKAKAIAFVESSTAVLGSLEAQLREGTRALTKAESEAESAEAAIAILNEKAEKNSKIVAALEADLIEAEKRWLRKKQDVLFEEFRARMHTLHDTVAMLIAVESHRSFHANSSVFLVQPARNFLRNLSMGFPYKGSYTPDWVHSHSFTDFPGLGSATDNLADQLARLAKNQETAP